MNSKRKPNQVVIMAGGLGVRMGALTRHLPKPMLPLGNKPVLAHIIDSFQSYGFHDIILCVKYKAESIRDYFGDGRERGLRISYVEEAEDFLGTAGPLSLIELHNEEPFILMNGDLMTSLNFDSLLQFHLEQEAIATMCIREYSHRIPFGIVNSLQSRVVSLEEKPYMKYFINAGIYVLEPAVLSYIPTGKYVDVPDLFSTMIEQGERPASYVINEFWMDIGRVEDYEYAKQVFSQH